MEVWGVWECDLSRRRGALWPRERSLPQRTKMGDFSDEVGAVSEQMKMMRMMAAAGSGGGTAAPSPAASPAPVPSAKPVGKPRLIERQLYVLHVAFTVSVSLPPSYVESEIGRASCRERV